METSAEESLIDITSASDSKGNKSLVYILKWCYYWQESREIYVLALAPDTKNLSNAASSV